jgi:excisionase family DNA binding protein
MSRRAARIAPAPVPEHPAAVEQHFTPEHFAELVELSVQTARRLEARGEIRGVRIAGRLRFPESEVRAFLARCATAPRRTPPPELIAAGGRPPGRRRRR